MRTCTAIVLTLLVASSAGCNINRARSVKNSKAVNTTPIEEVTITGSYSIAGDGTVAYSLTPRPDGDLVGTQTAQALTREEIDHWIRATTSRAGGSICRITSITGPYREDPDDLDDPLLYDLTIEVWTGR